MIVSNFSKRELKFRFEAKTSRGSLLSKSVYYICLSDLKRGIEGWGEAAPLDGLSIDDPNSFEEVLKTSLVALDRMALEDIQGDIYSLLDMIVPSDYPAIYFALETAMLDLQNGGVQKIFNNAFHTGQKSIPINGLIWMGSKAMMNEQVAIKIAEGYSCIKMKIGALNLDEEFSILRSIRNKYSSEVISLRVDANGAFTKDNIYNVLEELSRLDVHSIEQPVPVKDLELLQTICKNSPVPIALDEQLIGVFDNHKKSELLNFIKPQCIVLKPTLLGGLKNTKEWIDIAERQGIAWWMTSALESNLGLNAIAQFTAEYNTKREQGLGTGGLFHNNIPSPLYVENGHLNYGKQTWNFQDLKQDFE